jgi:hypothetical protein
VNTDHEIDIVGISFNYGKIQTTNNPITLLKDYLLFQYVSGNKREISLTPAEDVGEERDQWGSQLEFLLSCIAMSVGIGNFYRFPFVAYENGGGAFLIPYLIVLFFIGKPIYFLELALGQFSSYGQVKCWALAPFFKGKIK